MVEKHNVTFPVLYGMDGPKTAELLGSYYEEKRNIIQPTSFLLNLDKKIMVTSLTSGPIGRLSAEDVVLVVKHYRSQAAA